MVKLEYELNIKEYQAPVSLYVAVLLYLRGTTMFAKDSRWQVGQEQEPADPPGVPLL